MMRSRIEKATAALVMLVLALAINMAWQRESPAQEFATDIYIRGLYVSDDGDGPWTYFGAADIGGGGGSLSGSTGSTDNAVLRANGTGGASVQTSAMGIDDNADSTGLRNLTITGSLATGSPVGTAYGGTGADLSAVVANRMLVTTATGVFGEVVATAQGRSILSASTASEQRTALGLGTIATQNASSVSVGSITGTGAATFGSTVSVPFVLYDAANDTEVNLRVDGVNSAVTLRVQDGASLTYDVDGDLDIPGALTLGTALAVAEGGTGAATASTARDNLGLTIGTNVQAYDAELQALAGTTSAADKVPYFTGSGTAGVSDFSAYARTLLDDADAATAQGTLGLGTMATQAASAVDVDGGTVDGVTLGGSVPGAANVTTLDASGDASVDGVTTLGTASGAPTNNVVLTINTLDDPEIRLTGHNDPETARIWLDSSASELRFNVVGAGEGNTMVFDDHGAFASPNVTGVNFLQAGGVFILSGATSQAITAASTTLDPDGKTRMNVDPDASYLLTSTPTLQNSGAYDGEIVTLINADTVFSVSVQDNATLAGSDLRLLEPVVTVPPGGALMFAYSTTSGLWHQIGTRRQSVGVVTTSGATTLLDSQGGSRVLVAGAHAVTLPPARAGLEFWIVSQGGSGTVAPASGDNINFDGGNVASTGTLQPEAEDAHLHVWASDATEWHAEASYSQNAEFVAWSVTP